MKYLAVKFLGPLSYARVSAVSLRKFFGLHGDSICNNAACHAELMVCKVRENLVGAFQSTTM